jgi:hypothetical protein
MSKSNNKDLNSTQTKLNDSYNYTKEWIQSLKDPFDWSEEECDENHNYYCCEDKHFDQNFENISINGFQSDYDFNEIQTINNESICYESDNELNENYFGIPSEEVKKFRKVLKEFCSGIPAFTFDTEYRKMFGSYVKSHGFRSQMEMFCCVEDVFSVEYCDKTDPRLKGLDLQPILHDARYKTFKYDFPKPNPKYVCDESFLQRIPESLQIRVFRRIKDEENGLELEQIIDFSSVEQLGDSSLLVFFKRLSKLIPIEIIDNERVICKSDSDLRFWVKKLVNDNDICKIKMLANHPSNSVIPGYEYTIQSQEDIFENCKNKILPVFISNCVRPKLLWGQLCHRNNIYYEQFENLKKQMNQFYEYDFHKQNQYKIPTIYLIDDFICAAMHSIWGWLRVRIIHILDENQFNVRSVDFGFRFTVNYNELRLLTKDFLEIPTQLLVLSMNGVKCNQQKRDEYFETTKKTVLKYRLQNPQFVLCEFIRLNEARIEVIVFETRNLVNYFSINDMLLEKGLALKKKSYKEPNWELLYKTVHDLMLESIESEELKEL